MLFRSPASTVAAMGRVNTNLALFPDNINSGLSGPLSEPFVRRFCGTPGATRFRPLRRRRVGDSRFEKSEFRAMLDEGEFPAVFPVSRQIVREAFRPTGNRWPYLPSASASVTDCRVPQAVGFGEVAASVFLRTRRKIVPVGEVTREASFRPGRNGRFRAARSERGFVPATCRDDDVPKRRGRLCAAFASFDCPFGWLAEDTDAAQRFASSFPASIRP